MGLEVAVDAEVPALELEVDFGFYVVDEVDVHASAVGECCSLIMGVERVGGVGVGDLADASEDVDEGMEDAAEVCLGAEANEVGAFGDLGTAGVVESGFDGWCDGPAEVASEVGTEGCAGVLAVAEVRCRGDVAAESGHIHRLVRPRHGLGVKCRDCEQSENQAEGHGLASVCHWASPLRTRTALFGAVFLTESCLGREGFPKMHRRPDELFAS